MPDMDAGASERLTAEIIGAVAEYDRTLGELNEAITNDCIKAQDSETKLTKDERKAFRKEKDCRHCQRFNNKECKADGRCPLDFEKEQAERAKQSSCHKCPYRREHGLKCFPCTRKLLGEHIPELEEKKMDNKTEIIGIDHGWSLIKTANHVFVTGAKEITSEPALSSDTLEYGGRYYKIGGDRQEVRELKTEDDSFYLLTLAAIAKELKTRGGLTKADVMLAVGLPITRFGAEKKGFTKYLMRDGEATFTFEKEQYHIRIESVAVFPQCYAAVADKLCFYAKKTLVVDIGSWTIDIMPVIKRSPDESKCVTIPRGLITCMRAINEQCVRKLNGEVDESEIQRVMRDGQSDIDDSYQAIIKAETESFVEKLHNSIREHGYNLQTTPIVFVGGGAAVMKNFGGKNAKNISYITDVKANAKGYEHLARMALKNRGKQA
jgi:plasmid segregation protein ParM